MGRVFVLSPVVFGFLLAFANDAAGDAGQFHGKSRVEVQKSAKALDLNEDFTIEVWARWQVQDQAQILAGDEAWPGMHPKVKVPFNCGWVLRVRHVKERPVVDFTAGTDASAWGNLIAPIPKTGPPQHIAVCRAGKVLKLYLDGRLAETSVLKNVDLIESPSPIYIGPRKHGHKNRRFVGEFEGFRISQACLYRGRRFEPAEPDNVEPQENCLVLYDFAVKEGRKIPDLSGNKRRGFAHNVNFVP